VIVKGHREDIKSKKSMSAYLLGRQVFDAVVRLDLVHLQSTMWGIRASFLSPTFS